MIMEITTQYDTYLVSIAMNSLLIHLVHFYLSIFHTTLTSNMMTVCRVRKHNMLHIITIFFFFWLYKLTSTSQKKTTYKHLNKALSLGGQFYCGPQVAYAALQFFPTTKPNYLHDNNYINIRCVIYRRGFGFWPQVALAALWCLQWTVLIWEIVV